MTSSERWKTLVCFVLIYVAALSGSATEIRLKSRVDSQGSVVLLGDIASIEVDRPKSGRARGGRAVDAASLARIELFPAPSASRSRTVRRREVRELLSLHGVDLSTVNFVGAESVIIKTSDRPRLRNVAHSSTTQIVAKDQTFPIAKPIGLANQQVQDPNAGKVLALVNGLRRGEIVRQSNVMLIQLPVSGTGSVDSLGFRPVVHTEAVIGMEATRTIAANQPLDRRLLKPRVVIKRNDLVRVTSYAPGVRVQTTARALSDAAMGDLVELMSSTKRRKYTARATGDRTAAVYARGIKVSSPPERLAK